jgi:aminotransferase/cystathionine beta-lyase
MAFDFDTPQNRFHTDSIRWDAFQGNDILPLWVADMDFQSPPCIIEALNNRVTHGIFGYTHKPNDFNQLISSYLYQQYNWTVDPEWIVILPNVVSGLYTAVQKLTAENDTVLIPNPIYHHLRLACSDAGRQYAETPLELVENRWVYPNNIDASISSDGIKKFPKLALFCNPQNPGSTVFTTDELNGFAQYCIDHNLWICSDEIHAGIVLDESKKHIPIASLSKEVSERTVTLMSLTKTFNYSGTGLAWAVAENLFLRKAMQSGLRQIIPEPSLFSYLATVAAINSGESWRQELLKYLRGNRDLVTTAINKISALKMGNLEATYLAWIDCTKINHPNPHQLLLESGLVTSPGSQFGQDRFVRLNFGTQRARLEKALVIIQKIFVL